jgi:hypothetical protein
MNRSRRPVRDSRWQTRRGNIGLHPVIGAMVISIERCPSEAAMASHLSGEGSGG